MEGTALSTRAVLAADQQSRMKDAWIQFKKYNSSRHREDIINHYKYLIPKTRERIVPNVPSAISIEDLETEGYIALIKATDQFDVERNVKFESYAISMMRGAMLEYLRKEDWVPRSVRAKQKRLATAKETLVLESGVAQHTDEELA